VLRWTRVARLLAGLLVAVLGCARVSDAAVRPGDDELAITSYMQTLYQNALEEMRAEGIPEEGTKVTVADGAILYEYSDDGLRPLPLPTDEADGASAAAVESADPDGVLWPEGSVKLVRRVASNEGYFRADGSVRLPGVNELWGVDGSEGYDEGAFNYFGVKRPGNNIEVGVCTRAFLGGYRQGQYYPPRYDEGRWFFYHSTAGYGGPTFPESFWPTGGLAPGTTVFLRIVCNQDEVVGYAYAGGYGYYYDYVNATGMDPYGTDQELRRCTTMVLGGGTGGMINNRWSNVMIFARQPGGPSYYHLWGPGDTYWLKGYSPAAEPPECVSVLNAQPFYAETIWIVYPAS